jgi:hypothetical protein
VRKKKVSNPKLPVHIAIVIGISLVAITIFVNYYLDQSKISGQSFGDQLAQIQTDLKNETQNFDVQLTHYKNGQISRDQMLKITDEHIPKIQKMMVSYDKLKAPDLFGPSLQLFKLSTQKQIESDQSLRDWIATGDNATRIKSDQLLQQAFQYEMSALQSYNNAKSTGSQ